LLIFRGKGICLQIISYLCSRRTIKTFKTLGFNIHHPGHPDLHLRLRPSLDLWSLATVGTQEPAAHPRAQRYGPLGSAALLAKNFSITIQDRIIEGKARLKTVKIINDFIDEHEEELMELWGRVQRGEKITKIR
jgi:hypothetical protein